MPTDTYTKIVLTVIAVSLVVLCARQFSNPAIAQRLRVNSISVDLGCGSSSFNPCYISTR